MHLHFLGVCGVFMGNLALLARQQGHKVTGVDRNNYPPMGNMLAAQGIKIDDWDSGLPSADCYIVGNIMSRGMPAVEQLLREKLPYMSGPQWLANNVLRDKKVIVVTGTHGKTTVTSLIAWILQQAGYNPGYLIGGVACDLPGVSLGGGEYFVIEGDEYDSAFFDKRAKFVHYNPHIVTINNLEFDHADIYADLAAIQTQFKHMLSLIPDNGLLIYPQDSLAITEILQQGLWCPAQTFGLISGQWQQTDLPQDVSIHLRGDYNKENALVAMAVAKHIAIDDDIIYTALRSFSGVKRRREKLAVVNGVTVYTDFAHHPTAIEKSIQAIQEIHPQQKIYAVVDVASNTMRSGWHKDKLLPATGKAHKIIFYHRNNLAWDLQAMCTTTQRYLLVSGFYELISCLESVIINNSVIVIFSNADLTKVIPDLIKMLEAKVCDLENSKTVEL